MGQPSSAEFMENYRFLEIPASNDQTDFSLNNNEPGIIEVLSETSDQLELVVNQLTSAPLVRGKWAWAAGRITIRALAGQSGAEVYYRWLHDFGRPITDN